MTDTFGPQGRPRRSDDFEVRREEFAEKLDIELEPKAEPEFIPPEAPWDADRKSWWTGYLKRNPQARPKPVKRELTKFETTKIAPGTTVADYLPGLLNQLKSALENYAIFEEKLAAFEKKQLDECTSKGPEYQWIDGVCLKLDVTGDGANPENKAQKSFTKSIKTGVKTRDCGRGALCKSNGILHEHSPSGGIFGYELS